MLNKFVSGALGRCGATARVRFDSPARHESFGGVKMALTIAGLRRCSVSIACSIFVFMILALWTASLSAQNAGTISGHVSDPSGAVIPGATVTLTNTATNTSRTTVSTGSGDYTFPDVPPGV